ncbi:MAG: hypothetical protein RLZZ436_2557, partial [Planctomycetota bacterium]
MPLRLTHLFALLLLSTPTISAAHADEFPASFRMQELDPAAGRVVYAVTTADVDGDGDTDAVALTNNRVIWYEQPSWTPHVILQDQTPPDNVCFAAHDIDGDKQIDFAIGAGWTKTGTLHWISRPNNTQGLWNVHAIGEETSVHRMRWADVLGTGHPQLVVSPLNASTGDGVRLLAFEIPKTPAIDRWPATVLNAQLNRMHNHLHLDFDGTAPLDTITASREGLTLIQKHGDNWNSQLLSPGKTGQSDVNLNGAGEIRAGRLKNGRRWLAAVEPMHGDQLAVYPEPTESAAADSTKNWPRSVIHEGFRRGHALWAADLNGDGADELIFGHSDTPGTFGVEVWWNIDDSGRQWRQQVLDAGGMATEDLTVADLTGDGRPDILAGGRA